MTDTNLSELDSSVAANESTTDTATNNTSHPEIKSYVLRTGRLTDGQQRAIDNLFPQYGVTLEQLRNTDNTLAYLQQRFGNEQPIVLEIGFGMGVSLVQMAQANPHLNYLGVEVHTPGVGNCLKLIEEHQVQNLLVVGEDAMELLKLLPDASLEGLQLYFPDPWHKKRHHKRRIVRPSFMASITRLLRSGGFIHMATDWENYAEHMLEVLSSTAGISNTATDGKYIPRPDYRPLTKFELRGERLGHGVWDLYFTKD